MQQAKGDMERVHIDITVNPTSPSPPVPLVGPQIPAKLLAIMKKYKYNWRLDQLSKPVHVTKKYMPRPATALPRPRQFPKLNDEIKFYSDQLSRPPLRHLYVNRRSFEKTSKTYKRKINKNIRKAWGSIYNFYKKKERDRRQRQLRQQAKGKEKKASPDFKRTTDLAKPKPTFGPEPIKKKASKIFSNFDRLGELAAPKPYVIEKPKSLDVNPAALTYQPTEKIIQLAQLPARLLNLPKPLEPGQVKRSALRYNVTPRIEEMAQPKKRSEKSKEDEDYDPWAISKNALKYKATPRILEMAKPIERS
ncbi:uncharacterized protein LOC143190214 [Rhynchophorus ferrugineus]|uniref:uncharacterized protein LOC143190214 n=1 Tax=Rhynchophorus ferrugineus TaxID=354439 RepID=UPI003FCD39ED